MKLQVSTEKVADETILYLLELTIDGQDVYKIGITTRNIEQRVCEILSSHFGSYRYFPYCRPKRFRKTTNAYEYEQLLLDYFKEFKFTPYSKFSGSTELLSGLELEVIVQAYETLYDTGKLPESKKEIDEEE